MSEPTGTEPAKGPRPRGKGWVFRRVILGLSILVFTVSGIAWLTQTAIDSDPETQADRRAARPTSLAGVKSWGYQLQHLDVPVAARSKLDLLVVDALPQGRARPEQVARAVRILGRKSDGSSRVVLAYLSIGEAEEYRAYWRRDWVVAKSDPPAPGAAAPAPQTKPAASGAPTAGAITSTPPRLRIATPLAPAWLDAENPSWPGNYRVRYWDRNWQALLYGDQTAALDQIIDAGFDGVYLDRADVYATWQQEHPNAQRDMIALITAMADYARSRKPGFLLVMQNAEELLTSQRLRAVLDAVAKEDLLFGINGTGTPNGEMDIRASTRYLRMIQGEGRPILVVEYLPPGKQADEARKRIEGLRFVPAIAPRQLNKLGSE